jgi:allantoinase
MLTVANRIIVHHHGRSTILGHGQKQVCFITTTSLWCGQVVFSEDGDDDGRPTALSMGSIDINNEGTIVTCHSGESLSQAKLQNSNVQDLGPNNFLSPGLIDVHTHISALGRDWDGYTSATKAAAAGGITTVLGKPLNSIPAMTTLQAVELEREEAKSSELFVNVGLWGGVLPGQNSGELQRLLAFSFIFGLKAFLAPLPPAAGY